MLETNPGFASAQTQRQRDIDAIRRAAEFVVFAGIPAVVVSSPLLGVTAGDVAVGELAFSRPALLGFWLRLGLEACWLRRAGIAAAPAEMAAARVAAMFIAGERDQLDAADLAALPDWAEPMAAEAVPAAHVLAGLWPAATAAELAAIRAAWTRLGTAEALMETGGDIRLTRDPRSALNGYGCSHRPRPWAVTFASSTASSSSERGYAAADAARLAATAAMLRQGPQPAVRAALDEVRAALARIYGLPEAAAVILAASGTDTELLALGLTHLALPVAPILNILIAPEETGTGVPMAARGLHFAVDTALGHDVAREAPVAGYRPDTALGNIPLRDACGAARAGAAVEAEIEAAVAAGLAAGRRVILHTLDLSKTGLLAPGVECLRRLRAAHGGAFDIVVDACQARLSPASVRRYLALDAVVLITGSKFFTGPPFAGAVLVPPAIAARLQASRLPAGLEAYFGRDEFPAGCAAAAALPAVGNYGLALRWHAAIGEIKALMRVPLRRRAAILAGFAAVVAEEIAANTALALLPAPALRRGGGEAWECCRSIFSFSLAALHDGRRLLTPEEARAVYHWLNADLTAALPDLAEAERHAAARICHIGQPVKLPGPDGGHIGVLRVSAGARLLSGEPSHGALEPDLRTAKEFADLRVVFAKIGVILRNFPVLAAAGPAPRYR